MHDAQLLEDYVTRNSETAFQSLVDRYLNLVRSTALRQVRDTTLAEDVAQAVFILLARKAARLRKTRNLALGGWLYRTTRFVAARALRGELRHQRREQEAFQIQQITSADETWRRIAPLLDEGIEHLDQSGRDAIILRFFQDEPLQKVGDALGISEEAARKRVTRSLEKLRAFFVRRGFTIPTAALATALAGSRSEAAPAGLAGVVAAKALAHAASPAAMLPALVAETLQAWQWAKVKILAGVAAAATAVVLLAVHTWTPPALTTEPSPAARLAPNTPPAATQAGMAVKPEASRLWRLTFQAVDAKTGRGLPKARIMAVSAKDQKQLETRPQTVDVQTNLQTDARGCCDIGLPYPNPAVLIVGVSADGYEERTACGDVNHPLPDGYVLRLPRGFSIGGMVQDESGKPVAGAGIQILFDGTGTAMKREFQRERFGPPGNGYGVVATTDSAGRWSFGRCSDNRGFRIVGNHPDYPIAIFQEDDGSRLDPDTPTLKLDDLRGGKAVLVLKAGLSLRGEMTDEHGYPLAGARVWHDRVAVGNHGAVTASDGSFALSGLPPGKGNITITDAGFSPQRIPVEIASNTAPLAVQLKPGAVLRLRVVDETGSSLPDARVELERWQTTRAIDWSGLSDSDGRIVWNGAPLDPITLTVRKEGYCVRSDQIVLTADDREHIITMGLPQTLAGHVIDAETKAPIASFKVLHGSDVADGTNGQFQLKITEYYHEIVVLIEAPGYAPEESSAADARAGNPTCNVELKRLEGAGPIDGTVFLPDGSAIGGVQVALCYDAAAPLARGSIAYPANEQAVETDGQGHFHFDFAFGPRAVVAVHREGVGSVLLVPTNRSISIRLQPWGRIEGTLRLRTRPNAGQEIMYFDSRKFDPEQPFSPSPGEYTTKTDAQGNFVFAQAPPGRFSLCLSNAGHQTPVDIQSGATTVAQIGGTGCVLSGRLVLSNSDQPLDWSKRLLNPGLQTRLPVPQGLSPSARSEWMRQYTQTEEGRARVRDWISYPLDVQTDGAFSVEDVPPGDYELTGQLSDAAIDPTGRVKATVIGSFRQDVTVPQPSSAASGDSIDVGAIPVQPQKP